MSRADHGHGPVQAVKIGTRRSLLKTIPGRRSARGARGARCRSPAEGAELLGGCLVVPFPTRSPAVDDLYGRGVRTLAPLLPPGPLRGVEPPGRAVLRSEVILTESVLRRFSPSTSWIRSAPCRSTAPTASRRTTSTRSSASRCSSSPGSGQRRRRRKAAGRGAGASQRPDRRRVAGRGAERTARLA